MYRVEAGVLRTAILNEEEGREFYRMAAEKAVDPEVKAVFRSLAGEEEKHAAWLKDMYRDVIQNREPGRAAIKPEETASPGVFSPEKLKDAGTIEVSALHIGVMMEKASADYYREAAAKTGLEPLKELYLTLAGWEMKHLDQLEKAYDFARGEWWQRQGFSPA